MIKREGTGRKTARRDFENAKKHTRRDVLLTAAFSPAPSFVFRSGRLVCVQEVGFTEER